MIAELSLQVNTAEHSHGTSYYYQLNWEKTQKVNSGYTMFRGAAGSIGNIAFFNPQDTNAVYSYNYETKEWERLPDCPMRCSAFVVIAHQLITVGGLTDDDVTTNKLFSFSEEQWKEAFPLIVTTQQQRVPAGML